MNHRRSIRLQGYDYSRAGAYFVTICAQGRECLFGGIENSEMMLNECGCVVRDEWLRTAEIRAEIQTGEFVVMPNHFHGIIIIAESTAGAIRELPEQAGAVITVGAIDMTTSHLTRLSKNDSQVIGYHELPLQSPLRNITSTTTPDGIIKDHRAIQNADRKTHQRDPPIARRSGLAAQLL